MTFLAAPDVECVEADQLEWRLDLGMQKHVE